LFFQRTVADIGSAMGQQGFGTKNLVCGKTAPDKSEEIVSRHKTRCGAASKRKMAAGSLPAVLLRSTQSTCAASRTNVTGVALPFPAQPDRAGGHYCGLAFEPWSAAAHQDTADLKRARILPIAPPSTSLFKTVLNVTRVSFLSGTLSGLLGSNSSIMMTRFRKTAVFFLLDFLLDARILDIGPDLSLKTALHRNPMRLV
jgi:hypothetical protein